MMNKNKTGKRRLLWLLILVPMLGMTSVLFARTEEAFNFDIATQKGNVTVKGKAVVGSQKLELGGLNDIVVTPTVEFDSIIVKAVSGKVSPKIDAITESISLDLGDDVDFLKDASLKLKDPRITINLNSTVSVPIKLDLSLSSKDSDGDFIAESITPDEPSV